MLGPILKSTEILVDGENQWKFAGDLPRAMQGLAGITYKNKLFMTGQYMIKLIDIYVLSWKCFKGEDKVLLWDIPTKMWKNHSSTKIFRQDHAISIVPLEDVEPYCDKER